MFLLYYCKQVSQSVTVLQHEWPTYSRFGSTSNKPTVGYAFITTRLLSPCLIPVPCPQLWAHVLYDEGLDSWAGWPTSGKLFCCSCQGDCTAGDENTRSQLTLLEEVHCILPLLNPPLWTLYCVNHGCKLWSIFIPNLFLWGNANINIVLIAL